MRDPEAEGGCEWSPLPINGAGYRPARPEREAVGLLCDGLEAVEKELAEGVGRWVLVPANLHQSGVAVQPLVSRMKTLYAYTGIHWTEVSVCVV